MQDILAFLMFCYFWSKFNLDIKDLKEEVKKSKEEIKEKVEELSRKSKFIWTLTHEIRNFITK